MKKLLLAEGCPNDVEVSLLLTDDRRIQTLNKEYRNTDSPTDVLSFSQIDEGEGPRRAEGVIGDIVISVETAQRQALARGGGPDDEMELLAVHGALHLLGYNDETEASAEEMRRRAAVILGAERVR